MSSNHTEDRLEIVDAIRGFALFGILLVNMAHFSYPDVYLNEIGESNFFTKKWNGADFMTRFLLDLFVQTKFITMFSLLFGFGAVVMRERALRKGKMFVPVYIRRLFVLFLFGLIHSFFIWDGDILTDYALLGLILLLFQKSSGKTLLIWAAFFYLLYTLHLGILAAAEQYDVMNGGIDQEYIERMEKEAEQSLQTYQKGGFADIFQRRIHDRLFYLSMSGLWPFHPHIYLLNMLPYLSMFLVGMAFAKQRLFHDPNKHMRLLKLVWIVGLLAGLPISAFSVAADHVYLIVGAPFLMLFYVISFIFLSFRPFFKKIICFLAPAGRMSLTNYILQSMICTFIFYNIGLGLYGKVGPFAGLLLSIAVFAVQIIFSIVWFQHFRQGPLEWIWKTAAYLSAQPFRLRK